MENERFIAVFFRGDRIIGFSRVCFVEHSKECTEERASQSLFLIRPFILVCNVVATFPL